jgi:hypothetical protein
MFKAAVHTWKDKAGEAAVPAKEADMLCQRGVADRRHAKGDATDVPSVSIAAQLAQQSQRAQHSHSTCVCTYLAWARLHHKNGG